MVTECIKVSEETKKIIDKRKKDRKHTSRDSAVREFIAEADKYSEKEKECKEKEKEIKRLVSELKLLKGM
jgi:hypothetical protein